MSQPKIDGKKHISEKPKAPSAKSAFTALNMLDVPEDVKADCRDRGLEWHWCDVKQFIDNGNIHRNGWELYKRASATVSSGAPGLFGLPPDGTLRRGSAVLGVRPIEMGDAHRAMLRAKAKRQMGSIRNQAEELKAIARKGGLDERILDETVVEEK